MDPAAQGGSGRCAEVRTMCCDQSRRGLAGDTRKAAASVPDSGGGGTPAATGLSRSALPLLPAAAFDSQPRSAFLPLMPGILT